LKDRKRLLGRTGECVTSSVGLSVVSRDESYSCTMTLLRGEVFATLGIDDDWRLSNPAGCGINANHIQQRVQLLGLRIQYTGSNQRANNEGQTIERLFGNREGDHVELLSHAYIYAPPYHYRAKAARNN